MDSPHKCECNLYAMKSQIHKNNTIVYVMGAVSTGKLIRKLFLAKCHSFLDTSTKLILGHKNHYVPWFKGDVFFKIKFEHRR